MMKQVTIQEFLEKFDDEKDILVDVRENDEFTSGHIKGAVHIPLMTIPHRIDEFDPEKHYYIICRSGARSSNATMYLDGQGFDVTNIEGGMLEWEGDVEFGI